MTALCLIRVLDALFIFVFQVDHLPLRQRLVLKVLSLPLLVPPLLVATSRK
jgi:hypothetical protein